MGLTERILEAMKLYLPSDLVVGVTEHAESAYPRECCGILLGRVIGVGEARVTRAVPTENSRTDRPGDRFAIAPEEILEALRTGRERGEEIVGYYHSHPGRSGRPSGVDRRDAWSGTSYMILGMKAGRVDEIRSWRLCDSVFLEDRVEIEAAEPSRLETQRWIRG